MEIYKVLKSHKIKFIQAYTSLAYEFASFCLEKRLDLSFIKGVLCGSEPILPHQKNLMVDQMGLKVFSWNGHSETLVLGGYCAHTTDFHLDRKYGFPELLDDQGNEVTLKGQIGEIVGTTYYNRHMPLIRYRTGDYAEYVSNKCIKCGREGLIVKNIIGWRESRIIFRKDGSYTSYWRLNLPNELYQSINGIQFKQEKYGELIVLLVKKSNYREDYTSRIIKHFKMILGSNSKIEIRFVRELIKTKNGKFTILISEIN